MPCTCSACWFIKKGDHATAIRFLNRALDPGLATACSSLASLLMEKGDTDQTRILFKQAIQHDRKNAVAKHMLAALEGQTTTTAPRDYVVGLFDGCADYFDRQLADDPGYRAPQQLYTAVTRQVCLCNQSYRAM